MDSLQGLEGAKRAVLRVARRESGVHAVLLYGAEGAGKRTLAEALAQAWLCTSPTDSGACGECASCTSFERGTSADLLRVSPGGLSALIRLGAICGDDDEQQTPVAEFLRTPPLRCRSKVVLVESADRMNLDAANAFLKLLEEPPPFARIAMTTANVGRVIPTIISRCLTVACELPATDQADSTEAQRLAEGAPGRLAHIESLLPAYQAIWSLAARVVEAPPHRALALAEEFRVACEQLDDGLKRGARAANVEGLRAFGTALREVGARPDWLAACAEAHRRVQGNGSMGTVTDALFASILLGQSFLRTP